MKFNEFEINNVFDLTERTKKVFKL